MLRYLKAAFWVRERVPLLGDLPVNVLAMCGFGVLGFGHPAFWLLGLLGETTYLWAMTGSERFRKVVDAEALAGERSQGDEARVELARQLSEEHQSRLVLIQNQLIEVQRAYHAFASDDLTAESNVSNLRELEWIYLKLLVARQHLREKAVQADNAELESEVRDLERELRSEGLSETLRGSKEATLELLRKRIMAARHRSQTLLEIESDLERIETQFGLAVDSATMRAKPVDLHLDLDFASSLIATPELFGAHAQTVTQAEAR